MNSHHLSPETDRLIGRQLEEHGSQDTLAHYRLHGRDSEMWRKHPTPSHRYGYSYNDEELKGWTDRIEAMRLHADMVFAFTKNCRRGRAEQSQGA